MSEEVNYVDWDSAFEVLREAVESLNETVSELCESRHFDGCDRIRKEVMPPLVRIFNETQRKMRAVAAGEELPELDSERLGEAIRVLTREETREVLESGEFSETFDTNPAVRAAGAVAGDMIEDTETGTYYHVVRGSDLPPRGTGLETGAAEGRRAGLPRTEEERRVRHEELYGEEEELF